MIDIASDHVNKSLLKAENLPPHCGYPWSPTPNGSVLGGCGCGKAFANHREVYRCSDCDIAMHKLCLIYHFGDGATREVCGRGSVRSPKHTPHMFALQLAWLAEEVTSRDVELDKLRQKLDTQIANHS